MRAKTGEPAKAAAGSSLKECGSHANFAVSTMPFPAGEPVVPETKPAVSRSQLVVWPDALLITVCAGLLLWMLFVPPLIGLANDGDFGRVLGNLSLAADSSQNLRYFVSQYQHVPWRWNSHLPMSGVWVARVAVAISHVVSKGPDFDVRFLAALYSVLLLAAVYGLLRLLRSCTLTVRLVVGGLAIWIFTDVAYAAYFNSFYAEAMALVSLLLMLIAALHIVAAHQMRWPVWVGFTLAALFFVTSKAQYATAGIFPALFVLLAPISLPGIGRRLLRTGLCALIIVAIVGELRTTAPWYKGVAEFDIVFSNIPKTSPDGQQELKELGLEPSYIKYMGASPWPQGPNWLAQFYARLGPWKVFKFYLAHPLRTLAILDGDLRTSTAHLRNLPNYRRVDGFPPGTITHHFCSWSDLRSRLFVLWPYHILLWFGIVVAGASWIAVRRWGSFSSRAAALCLGTVFMAMLEFVVASLGDGNDTARHLLMFHALTDVTVCFVVAAALLFPMRELGIKSAVVHLPRID